MDMTVLEFFEMFGDGCNYKILLDDLVAAYYDGRDSIPSHMNDWAVQAVEVNWPHREFILWCVDPEGQDA